MRRDHVLFVGAADRVALLEPLLPAARFDVERADRYEAGLQGLIDRNPDVCLVAYQLDGRTALDFLRESRRLGSNVPVIFLTRRGEGALDYESMALWGADWLDATDLTAAFLECAIRYAIERRHAAQALRTSEARYRLLFERNLAGLAIAAEDGRILECNAAFGRVFGYDSAAEARAGMALAPPVRSALLASGLLTNAEFRLTRRDGDPVWVLVNATLIDAREGPRVVEASVVDITERKQAEQELRASEQRFRIAARSASDLISEWNLATGRLDWFGDIDEHLGYAPGEFPRTIEAWQRVIHADDRQRVLAALERHLSSDEPYDLEYRVSRKDGALLHWAHRGMALRDEGGAPQSWIGVNSDISHRRRAEEAEAQLRQAQKMEAIGRLAGGVAHDFNNLLTAILGHIELLPDDVIGNEQVRAEIDEIRRAAERAASLTRQLLAFSRRQVLQPRALDLNEVVANVEKLLRRLIGEDIELALDLQPGLKPVTADRGQIEQAIMNLAVNARDAMPDGGRLRIETSDGGADADGPSEHRFVMLTVSDTGVGMDQETLSHIYEPFFTTKGTRGTGLGLAMVYGFVEQSGGRIRVRSEPGRGASFSLYLPESAAPPQKAAPEAIPASAAGGDETILVVEDEEAVRNLVCRVLRRHGYTVLEAGDPVQATAIVERHAGPLDLLMTDMVMPQMNGRALAESLLRLRPRMRVLLMSGYTDPAVVGDAGPGLDDNFLQKPFAPGVLVRTVRAVLDQPASA